ncbi:hypothetical protein [Bosea sp. TAF32]|uniref:hypothetical protein n=1 Tax=Bosea sp. TAF32 TaxID=3237482 RepID=UPI003F91DDF6
MFAANPVTEGLAPWQTALLNTIAGPESAGKYNIRYTPNGGATFDGYDQHPGIFEATADGKRSSAAGRYQFTKTTWDDVPAEAKGDGKFTPENQDRAALWLASRDFNSRTGLDLGEVLQRDGMTPDVVRALAPTWQAFAKGDPSKFISAYNTNLTNPGLGGGSSDPDAANKPAPNALRAQFNAPGNTPGGFAVPPAQEQSIWEKLASGGPGALFGKPQQGWNFGDTMMNVGIALMARDNPNAAAALSRSMAQQNASALKMAGNATPTYDTKTGQMIVGGRAMPIPGWTKPAPEAKDQTYKTLDKFQAGADTAYKAASGGQELLGLIADGKLDPTLFNRIAAKGRGWLGMSDPNDVQLTKLQSWAEAARQAIMNEEVGVHTDSDAKRAIDQIASGEAMTDPRRLSAAIQTAVKGYNTAFERNARSVQNLTKKYSADLDPDGTIAGQLDQRRKSFADTDAQLAPRIKSILENPNPGGMGGSASDASPRTNPGRSGSIIRDQDGTIRHPNGVVIRPR